MSYKFIIPFVFLTFFLSATLLLFRSRQEDVVVLELRWSRFLGVQECSEPDEKNHFLVGLPTPIGSSIVRPCHWVWKGLLREDGIDNIPFWPNTTDLDSTNRIVIRTEIYSALLQPQSFPKQIWRLVSSDVNIYMSLLEAFQNSKKVSKVTATFGQVEKIGKNDP